MGWLLLAALTWAPAVSAQECTSCYSDKCPEMKSYLKPCDEKGPKNKSKKIPKSKQPDADESAGAADNGNNGDNTVAQAGDTPPEKPECPEGQEKNQDTAGHCCWPNQVWGDKQCVGIPSACPDGYEVSAKNQTCRLIPCPTGFKRVRDGIHCCWPGQGWKSADGTCVGVPSSCPKHFTVDAEGQTCTCPDGYNLDGEKNTCEPPPCDPGQKRMKDGLHCCWPGQAWRSSDNVCAGIPTKCPTDMHPDGENCVQNQ
jgi:hypothetical protein